MRCLPLLAVLSLLFSSCDDSTQGVPSQGASLPPASAESTDGAEGAEEMAPEVDTEPEMEVESEAALEADLPKVGRVLVELQGLARQAAGGDASTRDAAMPQAQALLQETGILDNLRETRLLAWLLPEVAAAEQGEQGGSEEQAEAARGILLAMAAELKTRAEAVDRIPGKWPEISSTPTPLNLERVLAVTGSITELGRTAQQESESSEELEREWRLCDSVRRQGSRQASWELVAGLDEPKDLYAVGLMLAGMRERFESASDIVLEESVYMPANRLAELGTPEAYLFFLKLHGLYGWDGGSSTLYKEMEMQHFSKLMTPERREFFESRW